MADELIKSMEEPPTPKEGRKSKKKNKRALVQSSESSYEREVRLESETKETIQQPGNNINETQVDKEGGDTDSTNIHDTPSAGSNVHDTQVDVNDTQVVKEGEDTTNTDDTPAEIDSTESKYNNEDNENDYIDHSDDTGCSPDEDSCKVKEKVECNIVQDTSDSSSFTSEECAVLPDESIPSETNENSQLDTARSVELLRSRFRKELSRFPIEDNYERHIEQTIQEFLASNEEIYDRCKGCIEDGTKGKTTFIKTDYEVVDAYYDQATTMFHFVTYPKLCRKKFDTTPLSTLPTSLDILKLSYKGNSNRESSFINYMTLFESSFMLHDDFLGPFLVKLKKHLETVNTCLAEIDGWLSTPSSNEIYLKEMFGVEKLEASNKIVKHFCIEGSHSNDELCFQCECFFSQHKTEARKVRGTKGHRRLCPQVEDADLPYFMCSKCDCDDPEAPCLHYTVEESYVLRKVTWHNSFDTNFDIAEEHGRLQLNKFIQFIESMASDNEGSK